MKWMIRADMEGVTGVVNMGQVVPESPQYSFGKSMLAHDLNAVLDGLLQAEHDEVWIYDIHFYGTNIELGQLDPRVRVICGKPDYTAANMAYLDRSFDGVVLLGLHSKSGTPKGLLAHNYEHDIVELNVNGQMIGEIGLEAMIAGESGVPVVLVTADSKGVEETFEQLPDTLTVAVKTSLDENAAVCYPVSRTYEMLRETAARVPQAAGRIAPLTAEPPICMELAFKPGALLNKLQARVPELFVSADRIVIRRPSVIAAWEVYLRAKGDGPL